MIKEYFYNKTKDKNLSSIENLELFEYTKKAPMLIEKQELEDYKELVKKYDYDLRRRNYALYLEAWKDIIKYELKWYTLPIILSLVTIFGCGNKESEKVFDTKVIIEKEVRFDEENIYTQNETKYISIPELEEDLFLEYEVSPLSETKYEFLNGELNDSLSVYYGTDASIAYVNFVKSNEGIFEVSDFHRGLISPLDDVEAIDKVSPENQKLLIDATNTFLDSLSSNEREIYERIVNEKLNNNINDIRVLSKTSMEGENEKVLIHLTHNYTFLIVGVDIVVMVILIFLLFTIDPELCIAECGRDGYLYYEDHHYGVDSFFSALIGNKREYKKAEEMRLAILKGLLEKYKDENLKEKLLIDSEKRLTKDRIKEKGDHYE